MEITKTNTFSRSEANTPTQHCISLIKQADLILQKINDQKKKKIRAKEEIPVSSQFLKAVKSLSTRLKTYKKVKDCLRRPVQTVVEKIGPGSYNVMRSFTPILSPANLLLEKVSIFKIGLKHNSSIITSNFIEKNKSIQKNDYFARDHNQRVMSNLDSRIVQQKRVNQLNRVRYLEKVGNRHNWRLKKTYQKIARISAIIMVALAFPFKISCYSAHKKFIRLRSIMLLRWLSSVLRYVGKIIKRLKRIRKRIADKNIIGICQPVLKFMIKKRNETRKKLSKVIDKIRKSNILFLLHIKWRKSIISIQNSVRRAELVKKARLEALYLFLEKYAAGVKFWGGLKPNQKQETTAKILRDLTFGHARAMIKYINDMKPLMNKFNRNMYFVEGNANSEFSGRNINFSNLKKPKLNIFGRKKDIIETLVFMEKTKKKNTLKTFKIVKKFIGIKKL